MVKSKSEYKGIQKKLVAAVAMVLVASIMVVTSSYAWFTLSTAPEVTGINTSVGSNGNLEMALQPKSGVLSEITTGGTGSSNNWPESNYYWGNLVNLSDVSYGTSNIALAPARLNAKFDDTSSVEGEKTYEVKDTTGLAVGGQYNGEEITAIDAEADADGNYTVTTKGWLTEVYTIVTTSGYLQTPEYGSDGRLKQLNANTVNGIYDAAQGAFQGTGTNYGVRAVGTTSNMSPEAYALRQAKVTVNSAIASAKSSGSKSMREYAVPMANIIVQNKLNSGTVYDNDDYQLIADAVTDLEKVVANLEEAMKQAVVAVGLSQGYTFTSDKVTITTTDITVDGYTLDWDGAAADEATGKAAIPDRSKEKADLQTAAGVIATMKNDLQTSKTALKAVQDTNAPTYTELENAMKPLISTSGIKVVNGTNTYYLTGTSTNELMPVAAALMGNSASIVLTDGIYADVASMVGDYSQAGLSMSIDTTGTEYASTAEAIFGTPVANVTFTMATEAVVPANGYHLVYVSNWMANLSLAKESEASTLITDTYGYIVDLAFRTNAADSSLLLQTEAADRVTGDDASSATWGGGSYMQFSTDNLDFTVQQIVNLMDYIRVVMVDNNGKIYGIAKMDLTLTDVLAEDGTSLVEYDATKHYFSRKATQAEIDADETVKDKVYAQTLKNGTIENGTVKAYLYLYDFAIEGGIVKMGEKKTSNAIMSLPQNQAQGLSCLVYLDGDEIENADVAISGNSMTGTMNLQFASSAALVPMSYTFGERLATPKATISEDGSSLTIEGVANATKYNISISGSNFTTLTREVTTETAGADATFTIPAEVPAGTYTITITASGNGYTDSNPVKVEYTKSTT